MISSPLLKQFESGDNLFFKAIRFLILLSGTLLLCFVFSPFRYAYWRYPSAGRFFLDPGSAWSLLDAFFIALLLFAETYAFAILFLGYLQTLSPPRRTPRPS